MLPRFNLLYSYAYMRKGRKPGQATRFEQFVLALSPYVDVLIDSGAFTDYMAKRKALASGARHQGITVDEYIAACKQYHGKVWQYIMLDVVQNVDASRQHLDAMLAAGLRPMPVFVYPEAYDKVAEMVEINPHICVAGGVDAKRRFVWQRYQMTHKASGGKARIHALGFVKHPDMFQLPLASVDSSSWDTGGRFGSLALYAPRTGFTSTHWSEVKQEDHRMWLHLQRCNLKPSDLSNRDNHTRNYGIPSLLKAFAYVQLHRHCYKHGLRFFFAVPSVDWTRQLLCIIATTDTATNSFDYPAARAMSIRTNEIEKKDPDAFIEWSIDVLRRKTAWQERLP